MTTVGVLGSCQRCGLNMADCTVPPLLPINEIASSAAPQHPEVMSCSMEHTTAPPGQAAIVPSRPNTIACSKRPATLILLRITSASPKTIWFDPRTNCALERETSAVVASTADAP